MQRESFLLQAATIVLLAFCSRSIPVSAQVQQSISKDQRALRILSASLAAMNGGQAAFPHQDSVALGTISFSNESVGNVPVAFKYLGSDMVRIEVSLPAGTRLMIQNGNQGFLQAPDGQVRTLQSYNLLAQRISHVPQSSFVSHYNTNSMEVLYFGQSVVQNRPADVISLCFKHLANFSPVMACKFTKTLVSVDIATALITKIEFSNFAENNSDASQCIEIFFSDYRNVGGVMIPFQRATYIDGQPDSATIFTSVVFDVGLQASDFAVK